MFDFIEATPAQKRIVHDLCERHAGAPCWALYDPKKTDNTLKVMFFTPKYLFEYRLNPDGYITKQIGYDNPHAVKPM